MNTRYNAMLNLPRQEDYGVTTKIPIEGRAEGPSIAKSINLSQFSFSKCDQGAVGISSNLYMQCTYLMLVSALALKQNCNPELHAL